MLHATNKKKNIGWMFITIAWSKVTWVSFLFFSCVYYWCSCHYQLSFFSEDIQRSIKRERGYKEEKKGKFEIISRKEKKMII